MNDFIRIDNLEVFACHGVYPEENRLGQKFLISAELYTDFYEAALNDDLNNSIDYGSVCKKLTLFLTQNTYKLIETAARKSAEMLLEEYNLLKGVRIEIKKPWAPIGLPVNYASVSTELHWHTSYIAFGSNMGDREMYINNAIKELNNCKGCCVVKVSDIIETEPYGDVAQDSFLNGVLELKTYLTPLQLLKELNRLESEANRVREVHWGPRTLDLDILLYDSEIIDSEILHIPHIDMHNRNFVLEPLCNIAPFVRHPVLNKTAGQLLNELTNKVE